MSSSKGFYQDFYRVFIMALQLFYKGCSGFSLRFSRLWGYRWGLGFRLLGCQLQCLRVWGLGFKGLGFRGLEFRGFRVQGFRVQRFEVLVLVLRYPTFNFEFLGSHKLVLLGKFDIVLLGVISEARVQIGFCFKSPVPFAGLANIFFEILQRNPRTGTTTETIDIIWG